MRPTRELLRCGAGPFGLLYEWTRHCRRRPEASRSARPGPPDGSASWRCCRGRSASNRGSRMKRLAVAIILILPSAAPNIFAGDNNPPPPQPTAAPSAGTKPQPPQDPAVRKLSRRERKEKMAKLGEKYQQFLIDVEPIMQ